MTSTQPCSSRSGCNTSRHQRPPIPHCPGLSALGWHRGSFPVAPLPGLSSGQLSRSFYPNPLPVLSAWHLCVRHPSRPNLLLLLPIPSRQKTTTPASMASVMTSALIVHLRCRRVHWERGASEPLAAVMSRKGSTVPSRRHRRRL